MARNDKVEADHITPPKQVLEYDAASWASAPFELTTRGPDDGDPAREVMVVAGSGILRMTQQSGVDAELTMSSGEAVLGRWLAVLNTTGAGITRIRVSW